MKSLSEIETISKRASRAVGFSWGEAEDIAKSVRLLEMFGLPGIKNLNQYYNLQSLSVKPAPAAPCLRLSVSSTNVFSESL